MVLVPSWDPFLGSEREWDGRAGNHHFHSCLSFLSCFLHYFKLVWILPWEKQNTQQRGCIAAGNDCAQLLTALGAFHVCGCNLEYPVSFCPPSLAALPAWRQVLSLFLALYLAWCFEKSPSALEEQILMSQCKAWHIPAPYKTFILYCSVTPLVICFVIDLEKSPGTYTEGDLWFIQSVAPKCVEICLPARMCCAAASSRADLGPNTPLETPGIWMVKKFKILLS